MNRKSCLTIAGSDPSGGAGIQGDLKTFCAAGVYGMAVLAALTAQNTTGVESVFPVPAGFVLSQLRFLFRDIRWNAAKTGMLYSTETVRELGDFYRKECPDIPLVVDPVMVASSGDALAGDDIAEAYRRYLFPVAAIVTPNVEEARRLTGIDVRDARDFPEAANAILSLGASAVLVKGGDLPGDDSGVVRDLFQERGGDAVWMEHGRVDSTSSHGTGCALAAMLTARLALGDSLEDAVAAARSYVRRALEVSCAPGRGIPSIDHLCGKNPNSLDSEM